MSNLLIGFLIAAIISFLAWQVKSLNRSGAIAATLIGTVIFGLGGWQWAAILLGFFISSSILSKILREKKSSLIEKFSKGSRRDAAQVFANGGVGALLVIIHYLFPDLSWVWPAYLGSFAAVNADTWATELGVLSKKIPKLITTGETVERGTSGAITLGGTLAALSGAFFIAVLGQSPEILKYLSIPVLPTIIAILSISFAGLIGSMVDSLLGATIQAIYHCPTCNKETEQNPLHHCGTNTQLIRGLKWLNNDLVNTICGLCGALAMIAIV